MKTELNTLKVIADIYDQTEEAWKSELIVDEGRNKSIIESEQKELKLLEESIKKYIEVFEQIPQIGLNLSDFGILNQNYHIWRITYDTETNSLFVDTVPSNLYPYYPELPELKE